MVPFTNTDHRLAGCPDILECRDVIWYVTGILPHAMRLSDTRPVASPYLLSIGLSKSKMAIVFVAGPVSGLVMQPLIGATYFKCMTALY